MALQEVLSPCVETLLGRPDEEPRLAIAYGNERVAQISDTVVQKCKVTSTHALSEPPISSHYRFRLRLDT
jgi:hypothetical protein